MKYTHLLFDVDDTLLDFQASQHKSLLELFESYHFPISAIETYKDISEHLWRQIERQEITLEELKQQRFSLLCQAFDRQPENRMEEDYEQLLSTHGDLMPEAFDVIQSLSQNYQLSIITNGMPQITLPRLKQSGIDQFFKHIFISESMGVQKPNPVFFEIVLQTLKTTNKDCLIIGDSLTSDIAGGIKSGIDTCFIDYQQNKSSNATYQISKLTELYTLLK